MGDEEWGIRNAGMQEEEVGERGRVKGLASSDW
jgi:hypothetical protein